MNAAAKGPRHSDEDTLRLNEEMTPIAARQKPRPFAHLGH